MVDTTTEYQDPTLAEEEDEFDSMLGIIGDGIIGAAGGLAGIALMMGVLFIASQVGAFNMAKFADLADTVGLGGMSYATLIGFAIFLGNGMFPFPLLFASLMEYMPGERLQVSGMFFGAILWTGFVLAFYDGFGGLTLVAYLVFSLIAHLAYGFGLGQVFEYFSKRPDSLV